MSRVEGNIFFSNFFFLEKVIIDAINVIKIFFKYSYSVHSFFLFLKVRIIGLLRSDRCS